MRTRLMVAVMIVMIAGTPLQSQEALTDDEVSAALSAGTDKKKFGDLVASCVTESEAWMAGYRVTFTSHFGEIASIAANAKKKSLPTPTVADLPEELRLPALYVWVESREMLPNLSDDRATRSRRQALGGTTLEGQVEHVVIRPEDSPQVTLQPLSQEFEPVTFKTFGAEYGRNRVLAVFPAAEAREAGTDRDLEVVIFSREHERPFREHERRCSISKKDVAKLFRH